MRGAAITAVVLIAIGAASSLAPPVARADEARPVTGTAVAADASAVTGTALPAGAGAVTGTAHVAGAASLEARVVYRTADGLYVDGGTGAGIVEGATGSILRGATPLGRFRVGRAAAESAFLVLQGATTGPLPAAGEAVTLHMDGAPASGLAGAAAGAAAPMGTRAPSPTLSSGDEKPFVPLLASPDLGDQAATEARNLFHGRVTARQAAQVGTAHGDLDYALTRVRTSGSLDRIDATPWAIEWAAEVSYRAGDGLERTRNWENLRAEVFQLSLFRRFEDRGFIRLGRFLPRELPAVGFLDGAHGEASLAGDFLRVGAMVGLQPSLDRLRPSLDEPLAAAYVSVAAGEPSEVRYYGTLGVLGSLSEGHPDRLAILLDQRLDAGAFGVASTSAVDLDVDPDDSREGARLTRWNLLGTWDAAPWLRLGAGLDRFEVPDTGGEREASDPGFLSEDELFDGGYWRYYGRATLRFPEEISLDAEASFTDEDGGAEDAVRGSLALTRVGLPGAPLGSITLAVYNLRSVEASGWGGRLSALVPLLDDQLSLQPAISVRYTEHGTSGARFFDATEGERLSFVDASLRAQWVISRAWTLFGGAAYGHTGDEGRLLVDVGVTWRW